MSQGTITPCGGCGESNPSRRCFGCHHDFGDKTSAWVREKEPAMTDATPPVLYISADTSDLTTRYKATPRMHMGANAWVPLATIEATLEEISQRHSDAATDCAVDGDRMAARFANYAHGAIEAAIAEIRAALAALPAPDEGEQEEGEG